MREDEYIVDSDWDNLDGVDGTEFCINTDGTVILDTTLTGPHSMVFTGTDGEMLISIDLNTRHITFNEEFVSDMDDLALKFVEAVDRLQENMRY